ncbi:hypothetical protein OUY22_24355 [Nonomuraea sp. MCN248]|uniref:DUF2786 domain-containing protein n=1 Tax=Nonomuraea corallina TaxID=2989783 RepID=A0ABT4SHY9_9ACTN|nr:hypothetical protein [Nonomuraea corallina]MDA0636560.1 hypothetical protein [Nonomuraea corallina]
MGERKTWGVEQVRALLDIAEGKGSDREEAQSAAALAAKILYRTGLDAETVRRDNVSRVDTWRLPIDTSGGHHIERGEAVWMVISALGCMGCQEGQRRRDRVSHVRIAGPAEVLESLKILLPSVLIQMEVRFGLAWRAERAESPDLPAQWLRRRRALFQRGFYRGYGRGLADKMRARVGEVADDVAGGPGELVLASREAAVRAEFERWDTRPGRSYHYDEEGFERGRQAAAVADLGDRSLR